MNVILSFAAVITTSIAAPLPNEKPLPGIDGKYNVVSASTPADRAAAANPGGGFPGGGGGRVWREPRTTSNLLGPATLTKNEMTFEGRNNNYDPFTGMPLPPMPVLEMTYTLDTTKTPMTIDVQTTSMRGKKTTQYGLVEVHGDRLVIAIAKESDERPKNTDENGDVSVYYLRKAPEPPKAPKVEYRIITLTVGKEADAEKQLNKLTEEGFELVTTGTPVAPDAKSSPTTTHLLLKRVGK